MKKSLLVGLMALSTSLSGYAFEAGEYVYAPQGRFKISSSDNLCKNSTCASNFDGWTVISATATTPEEVFQYDVEKGSFYSKTNVNGEGMYYKFNVPNNSGTYVVSFKLRQETAAYPYSTNILVTTDDAGVNTYGIQYANYNYVNVFGNSGGSFTSSTDYVSYGKELMLTKDWNNVAFAIVGDGTPRDYYIAFSGLNTTLEITDVQIQEAVQYADLRQRDNAVGYARAIINAAEWEASDELASVVELTEALEALTDENSQADLNDLITGLMGTEGALASVAGTGFLDVQLSNYIATCAVGTDWAQRTGNDKLQKEAGVGDWTFFGGVKGRGFNQDGADLLGTMSREWFELGHFMYGNALAEGGMAMTKTLKPGVYIYSMKASGATRYATKEYGGGWAYNLGFTPFDFELYVKDAAADTVIKRNVVATPTNDYAQNYIAFTIETEGDYEIGAKTYPREDAYYGTLGALGYGYFYKEPRIYCKLSGKYTAEQTAYIEDVKAQIEALKTALAAADSLSNLTYYPWLKEEMAATIAKYIPFNDFYQTLTDDDIINGFVDPVVQIENSGYANYIDGQDPETGKPIPTYNAIDTIMVNAVKPLLRANEAYIAANKVFPELQSAIDNANNVRAMAIYSVATGKDDLDNAITAAVNAYKHYAESGSYTVGAEENKDYDAMVEAKNTLNAAVEEFKTTIPAEKITTIVDIDFSGEAVLDESINKYSIAGTKGAMVIDNYSTTTDSIENYSFTKGYDKNGENPTVEVLRVGNGNGVVSVAPEEYAGKIVRITFDYYFGNLNKCSNGFYLKNDANENVAGLFYSPYSATIADNTFGFDIEKFSKIGSGSASNDAIYDEAKNKTSFELVLVYPQKTMYATSTNSVKGSQTTKPVALSSNFTQFVVTSNYNNKDRRSWFDNLKIETIEYDPNAVTGVQEVSEAADEAIYNIAGQKVSAPVKGQIYVKKGAAFVK